MSVDVTQRNATRNQSTADFQQKKIFLFDNRFENGVFKNNAVADIDVVAGLLVARDTATANGLIPVTALTLANVVGIVNIDGTVTLAENETADVAYATKGTINGNLLTLPARATLNSTVGSKSLKDVLEGIGFHVETNIVENTNFDN